jgi:hypothetical protein
MASGSASLRITVAYCMLRGGRLGPLIYVEENDARSSDLHALAGEAP